MHTVKRLREKVLESLAVSIALKHILKQNFKKNLSVNINARDVQDDLTYTKTDEGNCLSPENI